MFGLETAMDRFCNTAIRSCRLTTRRLMVVGISDDVERFRRTPSLAASGIEIAATAVMPGLVLNDNELSSHINRAIDTARRQKVSDVVVLTDWTNGPLFAKIAEKFMDLPAAVHLSGLGAVELFSQLRVSRIGTLTTVLLCHEPLSVMQAIIKRAFDICVASAALLTFAPLFLAIAILIKSDSSGPVFFRQRRRGFNQREFRIWKFRTMTTLDDGDHIVQATKVDIRVTHVGRILRKYNLDELPQLINVVKGEMSLVGPRPHAIAHDGYYGRTIERYARRLNVRPGITGWAQIKGHRGETLTTSAMQARVALDLHYIENWSVGFDVYILLMTVLSPKAYLNAH